MANALIAITLCHANLYFLWQVYFLYLFICFVALHSCSLCKVKSSVLYVYFSDHHKRTVSDVEEDASVSKRAQQGRTYNSTSVFWLWHCRWSYPCSGPCGAPAIPPGSPWHISEVAVCWALLRIHGEMVLNGTTYMKQNCVAATVCLHWISLLYVCAAIHRAKSSIGLRNLDLESSTNWR